MRVGIMIGWEDDFEGSVKKARSQGFKCGQVSVWDMSAYTEANAARFKAACAGNGFDVTSLWCGWSGPADFEHRHSTSGLVPAWLRNRRMEELLKGAEFARLVGIKDIVTHIGYVPDNPFDTDFLGVTDALRHIGGELKYHGQRLLFETGEELPVTMSAMMKAAGLDNLGVNFDPANLIMSGFANAADALRYLMPSLMGMHAKDALRPAPGEPYGMEVPIGQGHANFPELVKILKDGGYAGDITIEREGVEGGEWEKDVAAAKAYLEGLIG